MTDVAAPAIARLGVDKLGLPIAAIAGLGAFSPFAVLRANRIVPGEGLGLAAALPGGEAALLALLLAAAIGIALLRTPALLRFAASLVVLLALLLGIGHAAGHLTPEGDRMARVSPGGGFWLLLFAFALLAADALTRLRLRPLPRIG